MSSPAANAEVIRFQESYQFDKSRIDRDAGVIHNVKVLGLESKNRRNYREAIKASKAKYEGAKVFLDHEREGKERRNEDRWGKLEGIYEAADGLYAKRLVYAKEHRLTPQILEGIERFNDFGLSHDASGRGRKDGSGVVVEAIDVVHSVDLVQQPATTNNLFESSMSAKAKFWTVLRESCGKNDTATLLLTNLTEMDDSELYPSEKEMEVDEAAMGEMSLDEQVDQAFNAAVTAILNANIDTKSKIAKISMLLRTADKAHNANATDTQTTESQETGGPGKMTESQQKQLEELQQFKEETLQAQERDSCVNLLESFEVEPTDVRVNALVALESSQREALAKSFPTKAKRPESSLGRLAESVMNGGNDQDEFPSDPAKLHEIFH